MDENGCNQEENSGIQEYQRVALNVIMRQLYK